MAKRDVSIRLSVENHDTVLRALRQLGDEGKRAIEQIERATLPASRSLLALNAAGREAKGALQDYASRLGPVGAVMEAMGPAGMAAAAGLAGMAAAGAGLIKIANDVSRLGDELDEMSSATGVSVEHLSTLKYAADISGTSLEGLQTGFKALAKNALDAAEGIRRNGGQLTGDAKVWQQLGIEVTDVGGRLKPTYQLFLAASDALKGVASDTERAALAQQLFGRAGMELLPLLREGSAGIQEMQERARALGGEFSSSAARDAARYQDAVANLSVALGGLGRSIATDVIPSLTSMANGLAEIIAKIHELGRTPQVRIPVGMPNVDTLLPTAPPAVPPAASMPTSLTLSPLGSRAALDRAAMAGLGAIAAGDVLATAPPLGQSSTSEPTPATVAAAVASRTVPPAVAQMIEAQRQRLAAVGMSSEIAALRAAGERRAAVEKEVEAGTLALRERHQSDLKALTEKGADDVAKAELGAIQRQEVELYRNARRSQFAAEEAARQKEEAERTARAQLDIDQHLARRRLEVWRDANEAEVQAAQQRGEYQLAFERRLGGEMVALLARQQADRARAVGVATPGQLHAMSAAEAVERGQLIRRSFGIVGSRMGPEQQAIVTRYAEAMAALGPVSDEAGREAALRLAQGLRTELQVNQQSDFQLPVRSVFQTSLSGAFQTLFEGGSLTEAVTQLGQVFAQQMTVAISDALAREATDQLADLVKDGLVDGLTGKLTDAGKDLAGVFTGGMATDLARYFQSAVVGQGPSLTELPSAFARAIGINTTGTELGTKLAASMKASMSAAFVGVTLQSLGLSISNQMIITVSLASGLAEQLKQDADPLGKKIGEGLQSGLTTFMAGMTLNTLTGGNMPEEIVLGFSVTQGFLSEFAPQSSTIATITTGVSTALKGAVLGAGIGRLFGDEITAQRASIAGALGSIFGSAIGGAAGAAIGSGIGGLLGSAWDVLSGARDAREEDRQSLTEVMTDVSAFGGVSGYLTRIGGLSGATGRRRVDLNVGAVQDFLKTQMRTSLGLDRNDAERLMDIIAAGGRSVVVRQGDTIEDYLGAIRRSGLNFDAARISWSINGTDVPPTGLFTGWKDGVYYDNGEPYTGVTREGVHVVNGRPVAGKPVITDPRITQYADTLAAQLTAKRVSKTTLRTIGTDIAAVLAELKTRGVANTTGTAAAYWESYASGNDIPSAAHFVRQQYGIDVVAARGFAGTVHRPTTFLAGEAGPEDVYIVPQRLRRSQTGGGTAPGGGVTFVFHQTIQTPNVQSMERYIRQEMMPVINDILLEQSRRGRGVILEKGIIRA